MNFKLTKLILAIFIGTILIVGCESTIKKPISTSHNDSLLNDPYQLNKDKVTTVYNSIEEEYQEPPEISYSIFAQRKITIADPFDGKIALKKLYQGYTSTDEIDSSLIETWKCSKCLRKKFEGTILEDSIAFPSSPGNDTRILALYHLGDSMKILATTTSEYAPNHERTGRFTCGILGLALFHKTNNHWTLLHFNPALGCFGMFQTVEKPTLVIYKNNYLICLRNMNGGPGGPYTGDLIVIVIDPTKSKIVMKEINSDREGIPNGGLWTSALKITKGSRTPIPEKIQLAISGNYHYKSFIKEDTISYLPDLLRKNIKNQDAHFFVITKNYLYKNGCYKLEKEKIEQQPFIEKEN